MNFPPPITAAELLERLELDDGRIAVLFGNIRCTGMARFQWLLAVSENAGDGGGRMLFIAAEVNRFGDLGCRGSHFLGVFDRGRHISLGCSDDWGERAKFTARALEVAHTMSG